MSKWKNRGYHDRPADPAMLAAARLVENLAYLLPNVRSHARAEIAMIDGSASKLAGAVEPSAGVRRSSPVSGKCSQPRQITEADGEVVLVDCGLVRPCPEHDDPVELTSVEAAVEARLRLERWVSDVEQQCRTIATVAKSALESGERILGERLAKVDRGECRDGQLGKDGTIEWGDPLCSEPSYKGGLCGRHYMAWYRWRKANGVDTSSMFEQSGS